MVAITKNESQSESLKWAERNFAGAFSSDCRRLKRLIKLAAKMKDAPGKTLPQLADSRYDVKANYDLFKHPESIPDFIQQGHNMIVRNELSKPGTFLLIEDDSEFSWTGKAPIPGLGPAGDFRPGQQGFLLHSTLAVAWEDSPEFRKDKRPPVQVLGIADQQYFNRQPSKKRSERNQGAPSTSEFKETDSWFHSMDRIGVKPEGRSTRWVRVCDRRADIFEQFSYSSERGYDYIIRCAQDRALDGAEVRDSGKSVKEFAKNMPVMGQLEVDLRQRGSQPARVAVVNVSAGVVDLRHPHRKGLKASERRPERLNVVKVMEVGETPEPIEWLLFTSLDIGDFDAALEVVRMYTTRWLIEEFHKTLKSGLKAEELQLEHASRLQAVISIMSVVAISLVNLREVVRLRPDAPAQESGLDEIEITILSRKVKKKLPTLKDVVLAIGKLGGHLGRKGDGLPGLVTLWRGWTEMKSLGEGARLALQESIL